MGTKQQISVYLSAGAGIAARIIRWSHIGEKYLFCANCNI